MFLRLEGQNTVVPVAPLAEKFNIVSNSHGRMHAIFPLSTENSLFGQIWSEKIKIVSLT